MLLIIDLDLKSSIDALIYSGVSIKIPVTSEAEDERIIPVTYIPLNPDEIAVHYQAEPGKTINVTY